MYQIPTAQETYFMIANNTYQGLSTCGSIKRRNVHDEFKLAVGLELEVPLRCACATTEQAANGIKHLLTYIVSWNDGIPAIGKYFNVSTESLLEANGFSKANPTIFPFTTILVPLPTEPPGRTNLTRNHKPTIPWPKPASNVRRRKYKRNLLVGAAGSSLLVFLIIFFIFFIFYKKSGKFHGTDGGETNDILAQDIHVKIASIDTVIKNFKHSELLKATGNFSSKSRIKGCVYRGILRKEVLAIKKMGREAAKEVNILCRINHFNIINLRGFCENTGQFFLIFEYMKNRSLWEWLRRKRSKDAKTWSLRIQIALDIANGLLYLHNFAKPAYVHKDINSSNILLVNNQRAKISNFTFARKTVEGTDNIFMTRRVTGSKGYMAPEYMKAGLVTPTIDVYAFGGVLLELITGKDAVVIQQGREILLSAEIAAAVEENDKAGLRNFVEPDLGENGGMEYAFQVIKLSLSCLMQDPVYRPSMDVVVSTLIKIQINEQKSERNH